MRIVLAAIALAVFAPDAAEGEALAGLSWMAGCWVTDSPVAARNDALITETWTAPTASGMSGRLFARKDGKLLFQERNRIEAIGGTVRYEHIMNETSAARAELKSVTTAGNVQTATFVNVAATFPSQVVYSRKDNLLTLKLLGPNGTEALVVPYRAIACDTVTDR